MRTPAAVLKQWVCPWVHAHERDWDHDPERCRHCNSKMDPLDPARSYVGLLNPSSGD